MFKIAASDAEVVGSINSGNNKIILELINLREQAAIGAVTTPRRTRAAILQNLVLILLMPAQCATMKKRF